MTGACGSLRAACPSTTLPPTSGRCSPTSPKKHPARRRSSTAGVTCHSPNCSTARRPRGARASPISASVRATGSRSGCRTCRRGSTTFFACGRLGAIAVSVNTRFRSHEVADIVGTRRLQGDRFLARIPQHRFPAGILAGCDRDALGALDASVIVVRGGRRSSCPDASRTTGPSSAIGRLRRRRATPAADQGTARVRLCDLHHLGHDESAEIRAARPAHGRPPRRQVARSSVRRARDAVARRRAAVRRVRLHQPLGRSPRAAARDAPEPTRPGRSARPRSA